MSLRDTMIDGQINPVIKDLLTIFFDEADKLYNEIDNLSVEEFVVREKAMYSILGWIAQRYGEYYLISLYGLDDKVEKKYGMSYVKFKMKIDNFACGKPTKKKTGFFHKLLNFIKI